jgi:hypothetical protein
MDKYIIIEQIISAKSLNALPDDDPALVGMKGVP